LQEYDGIFLFDATIEEPVLEEKIQKIQDAIQEGGGKVQEMNRWGKMSLAYPVKKQKNGYFLIVRFSGESKILKTFEDALKYEESVLRHMITKSDGEPLPSLSLEK
jgi:small subunit ribosomal protein S6